MVVVLRQGQFPPAILPSYIDSETVASLNFGLAGNKYFQKPKSAGFTCMSILYIVLLSSFWSQLDLSGETGGNK